MAPTTADEFLDLFRKSGLIEPPALDRALAGMDFADARDAATKLVAAKLLTDWQAEKLLEGRVRGYFLGKYRLLKMLGSGAMGSVYLGEHVIMRHRVAIKVLARKLLSKPGYIDRFRQEARAAASVNHPRVVRAFDVDEVGDVHYLVMEFVEGENLRDIILRDGVPSCDAAAEYIRQTAEGLHAAHESGLIHRDIKPGNLILQSGNQVRILDLGLARLGDDDEMSLTILHDNKMIGTVDYLAPEQARNCHDIDCRADLYSLGCTLYYLLTGRPPFPSGTLPQRLMAHQATPPKNVRQRRPEIPEALAAICHKLLEKEPEKRFQTAAEVEQALAAFLRGKPLTFAPPSAAAGGVYRAGDGSSGSLVEFARSSAASASHGSGKDYTRTAPSDEIDLMPDEPVSRPEPSPRKKTPSRVNAAPIAVAEPPRSTALDDTAPEAALDGSETFAGLMEDWNALLTPPTVTAAAPPRAPAPTPAAEILRAARESQAEDERSLRDKLLGLVGERNAEGGLSPALWFCIVAGVLLGGIIAWAGYSYMTSFKDTDIRGKSGQESDGLPAPPTAPPVIAPTPPKPAAAASPPVAPAVEKPVVAPPKATPAPKIPKGAGRRES